MATDGHYTELVEGYELVKSINEITCARKFHDADAAATDSLPDIGDALDATDDILKSVKVVRIRITKYGNVPANQLYEVSYTNQPGTSEDPDDPDNSDPDSLPISGGLSGECINIDGTKSGSLFVWENVSGDAVDQQIFKKILTGSFKVTRRLANLEIGTWAQYTGKINSGTFKVGGSSFGAGLVLFNGAEYEEYRNSKGDRRWKVSFSFSVKAQPQGNNYYGWNYMYDQVKGSFRLVYVKPATPPIEGASTTLYESANLGNLLAGTEEP